MQFERNQCFMCNSTQDLVYYYNSAKGGASKFTSKFLKGQAI